MLEIAQYSTRLQTSKINLAEALEKSPLGPNFASAGSPVTRQLANDLAVVWQTFTQRLDAVPVIAAINNGSITREGYLSLLRNIRQQVIEGGRWIALAASSMSLPLFLVRSALIRHAADEHRDYQMLEKNYVEAGGDLRDIESATKNVGSEAFSAYMFYQASQPDPLGLFGAMFIIEGLGTARASSWAAKLRTTLDLPEGAVSFLAYHGQNDDSHYDKLRAVLSAPFIDEAAARSIVKTARTVARLYCLQLEELDHV